MIKKFKRFVVVEFVGFGEVPVATRVKREDADRIAREKLNKGKIARVVDTAQQNVAPDRLQATPYGGG